MNQPSNWHQPKRVVGFFVAGSVLLQAAMPAYAVVGQLPGVYVAQPDANVMYTLDDSGSMSSDAIPDFLTAGGISLADMPTNANSNSQNQAGAASPGMWRANSDYLSTKYYQSTNAIARYLRSSSGNPLYYDPKVTYSPWPTAANDKLLQTAANPKAVNIDASIPTATTRQLDLTTRVNVSGGAGAGDNEANNYWLATHYVYKGTTALPLATPNTALNTAANFTKVEIKPSVTTYTRAATRTDCTGAVGASGCSYAEELQNFANWLQYYRSRMLMAKGGVSAAFAKQGTNLRVGFGTINSGGTIRLGVRAFSGTSRVNFYTDLFARTAGNSTPLRQAMDQVGQYFQTSDTNNPWAFTPGTTIAPEYDCRRSFHILSTDGFWNGNGATAPANADNDNFAGAFTPYKPDGTTRYAYTDTPPASADPLVSRFTVSPFRDMLGSQGDKLSDVAAYYWRTDLRSTIANNVSPSTRDPAFWQHLTTFTVGLGVSGSGGVKRNSDASTLVPAAEAASGPFQQPNGLPAPWLQTAATREALVANKVPMDWPDVNADSAQTGDDLIRAAMVGRGRYFSATNPTDLALGLASALAEATDVPLSLANLAPSSGVVSTGSQIYQATYNPSQWFGRLYAFNQAANGAIDTTPSNAVWEASHEMPAPASRNIYTWDGAASAPSTFTWGGLNSAQRTNLGNDSTLVDYLRGSSINEQKNGGSFRDRSRYTPVGSSITGGILGDVVNGSPVKAADAGAGFQRLPAGTPGQLSYETYRSPAGTNLTTLLNTIFLGANDGMLHAFNRLNGVERFAFVPNSVFSVPRSISGGTEQKLRMLSDPAYQHRFTVDGPPQVTDAFFGTTDAAGQWRTVLNASTGAGARSIFLMDVTNPEVGVSGGFVPKNILWEFSETNNVDMGYMLSYGHVTRMKSGQWALIFGNGYDSSKGQAKLFILDLYTGALIREIAVGAAGGNGLSQPNFTLKDRTAEYIYASDLKGNLWKIDVTSSDPSKWAPSFGSAPNYAPLYTTPTNQPITVMPTIGFQHPNGGNMLSFGTGKLFEVEDSSVDPAVNVNLTRQAIYGIWDKPGETAGFSGVAKLQIQGDVAKTAAANANLSGSTSNTVDWSAQRGWYYPLKTGGERVNVRPQIPDPVNPTSPLFVVANTPAEALPCVGGGTARLFALDVYSGGALPIGVFDADGNGRITKADAGFSVLSINTGVATLPLFQTLDPQSPTEHPIPEADPSKSWNDGRLGTQDGGREDITKKGPCTGSMTLGISDTSTLTMGFNGCADTKGRISWRQIQ